MDDFMAALEHKYGVPILISDKTGQPVRSPEEIASYDPFPSHYVWVCYSTMLPYLPLAVADTAQELAKLCDTGKNNIESQWSKYRHGKLRHSRYQKVYVGAL